MASVSEVLEKIIKQYQAGSEFGKGEKALLGRAKTKAMAGVGQQLVSAGLAGTTAGASAGQRWEEEIGMPARLKLEDVRVERLMQALLAKAGYLQEERKMQFQASESAKGRVFAAQQSAAARPSMAERGLDVFGRPLAGAYQQPTTQGAQASTHTVPDFTVSGRSQPYRSSPADIAWQDTQAQAQQQSTLTRARITSTAPDDFRVRQGVGGSW